MRAFILLFLFVFPLTLLAQDRVGYYRGTFDPPHLGHKEVVLNAIEAFDLDVLYIIVNFNPSHKSEASGYEHRVEMTRLVMADQDRVVLPSGELERAFNLESVNAGLEILFRRFPEAQFFHVVGEDGAARASEVIMKKLEYGIRLAVCPRKGCGEEIPRELLDHTNFSWLPKPRIFTSSTKMRKALSQGEVPANLPYEILPVIDREKLYGSPGDLCQRILEP